MSKKGRIPNSIFDGRDSKGIALNFDNFGKLEFTKCMFLDDHERAGDP